MLLMKTLLSNLVHILLLPFRLLLSILYISFSFLGSFAIRRFLYFFIFPPLKRLLMSYITFCTGDILMILQPEHFLFLTFPLMFLNNINYLLPWIEILLQNGHFTFNNLWTIMSFLIFLIPIFLFFIIRKSFKYFNFTFLLIGLFINVLILLKYIFTMYLHANTFIIPLFLTKTTIWFNFGFDSLSITFLILSTLLIFLCILISYNITFKDNQKHIYFKMLLLLHIFLLIAFSSINLFWFLLASESVLIPLVILIGYWGSEEKGQASVYLLFYTMASALGFLIALYFLLGYYGETNFLKLWIEMRHFLFENHEEHWIWWGLILAFAVKTPVVPFHLWLPKAHVEAPTVGSILLAGILLKLGLYGVVRFTIPFLPEICSYYSLYIMAYGCIVAIYAAIIAIRQLDLKRMVAYSSVSHMNFAVAALFALTPMGIISSLFLLVSHGLISSGLFLSVGALYNRFHTRNILYLYGLIDNMPKGIILAFLLILGNMAFPLTSGFVGEIFGLLSLFERNFLFGILGSMLMLFTTIYSFLLFNRLAYGLPSGELYLTKPLQVYHLKFTWFWLTIPIIPISLLLFKNMFYHFNINQNSVLLEFFQSNVFFNIYDLFHTIIYFIYYIINYLGLFLGVVLPVLIGVAFLTLAERKIMSAMQRRIGPNVVGPWGLLQPFADGLKLLTKQTIIPSAANKFVFLSAPGYTFVLALTCWTVIPFQETAVIADIDMGVLFLFALSVLNVHGIIMAGWASNSKYAFLGAIRAAAQMISYDVSMGLTLLSLMLCANSSNLIEIITIQKNLWFIFPFFISFLIFLVSILAETNRAPFDLVEAEAELVAGYNVEYSAVGFTLFFLGEYSNILLMSTFCSLLFLGGWLPLFGTTSSSIWLVLKIVFIRFLPVWIRATLPRYRYDHLMMLGWKVFLPVALGFYSLVICFFLFCFNFF